MKPTIRLVILVSTLFVENFAAQAQSYALSSFTIDGGGGTSSGGNYTLSGTIGQPDAGTLAGGSYKLVGGFWNDVLAVPIPGGSTLTILRSGSTVIIAWPSAATVFVLEAADSLSTSPITWTPVSQTPAMSGNQQIITVSASSQTKLYRLRGQ